MTDSRQFFTSSFLAVFGAYFLGLEREKHVVAYIITADLFGVSGKYWISTLFWESVHHFFDRCPQ